jgi:type I restriction enzyme S subunit
VSAIYYKDLKDLEIPLPPLDKQIEIVEYIDEVFAETSQLKNQYQNKLIELKELKASILQSAFEGKLV